VSDTAYHSFIGEVEALNTTTIRRLTPSRRHQLLAIAPMRKSGVAHAYSSGRAVDVFEEQLTHRCRTPGEA
jgi:hypothetical protein